MTDGRPPKLLDIPAFTDYIGKGWDIPDRTPVVVPGAAEAAAAHRARLGAALPGRTVVVAAGQAPVRSNDTSYDFRPGSDFYWLTGCVAEDAVAVIRDGDAVVYLPVPAYPGEPGFFADAAHGELWVGAAPGLTEWSAALGVPVRPLTDFDGTVSTDDDIARVLAELRMIKDDWEIGQLREAVDRTVEGFAAVLAEIPTAVAGPGERWLQGTFDRYARAYGNGPGYATIVGSGPHAPTLHWVRCDGPVLPDELLLLDMGVEVRSHYTADVTRTFPASGAFSPAQRQVHDLVERAHRAALAQVAPGRRFTDFHHAAMEVIARGLDDWGMLPVSVDEALSERGQHHRRYLICGIGHHLGLDVHDCAKAAPEAYQGALIEPGMVFTVEPGLYFHAHDLTVPPELRGIGARIEDDLLVTADGIDVLSAELPLSASGLEDWMRR
ncbi:aminopeptidase P family protein [Nonomuraea sp. NPDC049158]|uniref:aminopeptidase P family protein n=1 Tax=Nonomuraea sp. NPDC049158 TaxID=3155649 RepID=UPI0033CEC835